MREEDGAGGQGAGGQGGRGARGRGARGQGRGGYGTVRTDVLRQADECILILNFDFAPIETEDVSRAEVGGLHLEQLRLVERWTVFSHSDREALLKHDRKTNLLARVATTFDTSRFDLEIVEIPVEDNAVHGSTAALAILLARIRPQQPRHRCLEGDSIVSCAAGGSGTHAREHAQLLE